MNDEILKLLNEAGLDNAEAVATKIQESIDEAFKKIQDENELRLAERLTALQEAADTNAEIELQQHREQLEEWHKNILETELAECQNELMVANEIRNVRNGLEKIMEGMREAGLDTTQIYESVAAAEVLKLQEEVEKMQDCIEHQDDMIKSFQRAFIVSEATRDLTLTERDFIIEAADNIDESIALDRFTKLVDIMVTEKRNKNISESKSEEETQQPEQKMTSYEESLKFSTPRKSVTDLSRFF